MPCFYPAEEPTTINDARHRAGHRGLPRPAPRRMRRSPPPNPCVMAPRCSSRRAVRSVRWSPTPLIRLQLRPRLYAPLVGRRATRRRGRVRFQWPRPGDSDSAVPGPGRCCGSPGGACRSAGPLRAGPSNAREGRTLRGAGTWPRPRAKRPHRPFKLAAGWVQVPRGLQGDPAASGTAAR